MTGYPTQTSQSWTGMCGDITFGTYTLDATDGNGCTASTNITLTEPLPFVYTVDSTPEYCGDSNGTASIFITQGSTGGTAAWAGNWDWAAATAPTLTATAAAVDRIDYVVRTATSIHAVATLAYS